MDTIGSGSPQTGGFRARPAHFLLAAAALDEIRKRLRPADTVVAESLRRARSGSRDRAQVTALVYGVLRNFFPLLARLGPEATMLELCVAHALDSGQPVPPLREIDIDVTRQRLARDARLSPAQHCNLQEDLWQRLSVQYGEGEALELARALNTEAGVHLRVNTLRGTREEALARLATDGIEALPLPASPVGLQLGKRVPLQGLESFRSGWVEPQDGGSQRLAAHLDASPGERIADFCAGAGGKTLALGAAMQDRGELHAFDTSKSRLHKLRPRAQRAGLTIVSSTVLDGDGVPPNLVGHFDGVLVDAPCSGTGALRRHPELRLDTPDLDALAALQEGILARAATLVRPGGRLVYATCSVLREENEAVTERFLARHPQFRAEGEPLRLLPHRHGTDGYYALRLRLAPEPAARAGRQ